MAADVLPERRPLLPSLTGLRAISALVVFLLHIVVSQFFLSPTVNGVQNQLFVQAPMAVSLFFVLSGFVLTWTARAGDTVAVFWRRRVVKLWPNHTVTWAVMLAVIAGAGALGVVGAGTVVLNLFLLQAWSPSLPVFFSMNMPAWSLSCEIFFYLCFPFLLRAIAAVRPSRLYALAGAVLVVVLCVPVIALLALHGPEVPHFPAPITQFWFVQIFPVTRIFEFVLGIVLARLVLTGKWVSIGRLPTVALAALAYLLFPHIHPLFAQAVCVLPMALLIGELAVSDVAGHRTFLRGRRMVFLGEVSFAFYLVHQIVIGMVHLGLGADRQFSTGVGTLIVLACLAISIGLSVALYKGVEAPAMRRWSRARSRRPAQPAVALGTIAK